MGDPESEPVDRCFYQRNQLELRLYEAEEIKASESGSKDAAYYRLLRLTESLVGFHKVSDSSATMNAPFQRKR